MSATIPQSASQNGQFSWNHLTENIRLENEAVGGERQGVGVGVRAGLDTNCNLLAACWERASRHPHLFVRSLSSGRGNPLIPFFLFHLFFCHFGGILMGFYAVRAVQHHSQVV